MRKGRLTPIPILAATTYPLNCLHPSMLGQPTGGAAPTSQTSTPSDGFLRQVRVEVDGLVCVEAVRVRVRVEERERVWSEGEVEIEAEEAKARAEGEGEEGREGSLSDWACSSSL